MSDRRSKFDVPHEAECRECHGRGVTWKTAPEMRNGETVALGSGCPECLGVGRVEKTK